MKVRVFGLKLNACPAISSADLLSCMADYAKDQQVRLENYLRAPHSEAGLPSDVNPLIAIEDIDGDFIAGVILKVRDATSFFQLSATDGKLEVHSETLDKGIRHGEVNFFILRKENLACLYAYYHQSTHMSGLAQIAGRIHNSLVIELKKQIVEMLERGDWTADEAKRRKRQLHNLGYDLIISKKGIDRLIDELKKVKNARISFQDMSEHTKGAVTPLLPFASRSSVRIVFENEQSVLNEVKARLKMLVHSGALDSLRIEGIDPDGSDQVILLEKNLEHFAERDYDTLMSGVEMNFASLRETLVGSNVIKFLRQIADRGDVARRLSANTRTTKP